MLSGAPRMFAIEEWGDFRDAVISKRQCRDRLGRLDVKTSIIQNERTNDIGKPPVRSRETESELLLDPSHDFVDGGSNRVFLDPLQIKKFQRWNRRPKIGNQDAGPIGVIDASSSALSEVNGNRTRIPHPDADHLTDIISLPPRAALDIAKEAALLDVRKRIIHPAVQIRIFQVLLARIQVLQSTCFSVYSEHH